MAMKAIFFLYCTVLLVGVTWTRSLDERHSRAITITYYSHVTIADNALSYGENGLLASYSNRTVSKVTGLFYEPSNAFVSPHCLQREDYKKRSPPPIWNFTVPKDPFVALMPIENCDHYSLADLAARWGAKGVVFYGSTSTSSITSYHGTKLSIIVAYIQIDYNKLDAYKSILDLTNTNITISIRQINSTYRTSQTFYFVVFAFTVLVLLSLVWFVITYIRRCHSYCSRRRTRRRERQETTRAITSLPTKKHKITKSKTDTDSVTSVEEPTCAVCLEIFRHNEVIRPLPCGHEFHKVCIDPWLLTRGNCPLCKTSIVKRQTSNGEEATSAHTSTTHTSRVTPVRSNSVSETIQLTTAVHGEEEEEEEGLPNESINSV